MKQILEIVLATRNPKKLRELAHLLRGVPIRWRSLREFPTLPPIREDGRTFRDNAIKKARTVARLTNRLALADDSGLVVKALRGAPGVRSARFAGRHGDDRANNRKILRLLEGLPSKRRAACFHCVLALAHPRRLLAMTEGRLAGLIATQPHGRKGFGYDPIFWVPQLGKTVAQCSLLKKNQMSHRAQAARRMRRVLDQQLPRLIKELI